MRPRNAVLCAFAFALAAGYFVTGHYLYQAPIGLDEAGARRCEIGEGPFRREDLEGLAGGRRDEQVEARRHSLRFEERGSREQIAQREATVAAEQHLRHGFARELAHRTNGARFIPEQRIDGA